MYQLGWLFIFGQKLIRVYVRGCIKNALLSISNEIDCTVSQKKNHSELQKFKKGNVAAIWLCKKLWLRRPETFENELQKRKHFLRILLIGLAWLI